MGNYINVATKTLISSDFRAYRVFSLIFPATSENPISRASLVEQTGISDKKVRKQIEELRRTGARIGVSPDGKGYYLCHTEKEYAKLRREIYSRIVALAFTLRRMDENLDGQVEWEFEDGEIYGS